MALEFPFSSERSRSPFCGLRESRGNFSAWLLAGGEGARRATGGSCGESKGRELKARISVAGGAPIPGGRSRASGHPGQAGTFSWRCANVFVEVATLPRRDSKIARTFFCFVSAGFTYQRIEQSDPGVDLLGLPLLCGLAAILNALHLYVIFLVVEGWTGKWLHNPSQLQVLLCDYRKHLLSLYCINPSLFAQSGLC